MNELIKIDPTGKFKAESDLLRCCSFVGVVVPGV